MTVPSEERIDSFKEFYPYYLSEHKQPLNRVLHFVGSTLALIYLVLLILTRNWWFLLSAILTGYFFAWIGHFFVEKNRPATFKYPIYSFLGDWKMFYELLSRKRPFKENL